MSKAKLIDEKEKGDRVMEVLSSIEALMKRVRVLQRKDRTDERRADFLYEYDRFGGALVGAGILVEGDADVEAG